VRAYLDILRLPGAAKFCAAGILARSGGAMVSIGIVLLVSALYGSYGLAGAVSAANGLAWAIGAAILSGLVDRHGQRRVMWPALLISTVGMIALVVLPIVAAPVWTLFPAAMVTGGFGGSVGALVRARWSYLTRDAAQRHTAFSLESTLDELTYVVGPVVATALSTGLHPAAGLVAPIVLGLVGGHLFYSQKATEPPTRPHPGDLAGVGPLWRRLILLVPGVGPIIAVDLLVGAVFGAIDVTTVAATTTWGVRSTAGLILAVFSLGSAAAGFFYGSRTWAASLTRRFLAVLTAMAVFCAALLVVRAPWELALTGLFIGLTVAPTLITANSLIERLTPPHRLTEGLAWMGTGLGIGGSLGASLTGHVIDQQGYHMGFLTVTLYAAGAVVIALASWRVVNRSLPPLDSRSLAG